jgi:phosphatidate cytidylyltransferase
MLRQRVLVVLVLLPIGLIFILVGGWLFAAGIALIMGLAAYEYDRLFRVAGLRPGLPVLLALVVLLSMSRHVLGFGFTPEWLALAALAAMTWHLIDYERGAPTSGTDLGVTLGGIVYVGWIGAYFVSLRSLPDGAWWVLLVLPVVWLADSAAFFVGRRWGRHRLAPRLSPKKSWEGYLAGVAMGAVAGIGLAWGWSHLATDPSAFSWRNGLVIGVALSVLTTLGDLGESMLKRQVEIKDSGNLLPGHGGILDRIDSWLWAAVLGYYLILWLT